MTQIHHLAAVDRRAKIGKNVTIEPFAVVKENVVLHDNVTVKSHAYIDGYTEIGEGTVIWPGASIGTKPQDLKFKGEKTYVKIGKRCDIREYATINSSCGEETSVIVGDHCLIMAYCHIAHNCEVGNYVVMANSAMLAGHVIVEDYAIIGGMTPVHQFSRIGQYAMVGGFSAVSNDIPPYTIGAGRPYRFGGLNVVGLKRHNFSIEIRTELSKVFKIMYRSNLSLEESLEKIKNEVKPLKEVENWIKFCQTSKRGLQGLQGITQE